MPQFKWVPSHIRPRTIPLFISLFSSFIFLSFISALPLQADLGLSTEDFGSQRVSGQRVSGTGLHVSPDNNAPEGESNGSPGTDSGEMCLINLGNGATEDGVCGEDGHCIKTNSYVNLYTREYQDDIIDMSLKAPGGHIKVQRIYGNDRWQFEHEYNKLDLSKLDQGIILKSNLSYQLHESGSYRYKSFRIHKETNGYRWQNRTGSYTFYSQSGLLQETGNRNGVLARYNYTDDDKKPLLSIANRNNEIVFTFQYTQTQSNPNAVSVSDIYNRKVHYKWKNNELLQTTNVLGNTTAYHYHPDTH